jgi:hypothetical protein
LAERICYLGVKRNENGTGLDKGGIITPQGQCLGVGSQVQRRVLGELAGFSIWNVQCVPAKALTLSLFKRLNIKQVETINNKNFLLYSYMP